MKTETRQTELRQTAAAPARNYLNEVPLEYESEVDIDEVKSRIRAAASRRQAEGGAAFIKASAELFELLSAQLSGPNRSISDTPALQLQPGFIPHTDDHYQIEDLLKYHDRQFIWNAYRALLKREPDEPGLQSYLETLRSGRWNKIDVLASLRFSPEGRRKNVTIDRLRGRAFIRRLYRVPVLGYFFELAAGFVRLPSLIRNQRAIETHLIAQQDRTAAHLNDVTTQIRAALANLNSEQEKFARLQHQQLSALFMTLQKARYTSANDDGLTGRQTKSAGNNQLDEIYANLHNQIRGDSDTVRESLRIYLPLLAGAGIEDGILDLGSGRGEWLDLLRDRGLQAQGVESNKVLAARAQTQGFDVIESEAVTHLRGLRENSLNAVSAFHLVEHLDLDQLIDLISEVRRTLKPGGLFVIETPNPKNLVVGACNFHSDPTHRQPLFPETLDALIRQLGFNDTNLEYLHPVEGSPFSGADEASRALNSWLFSARDYSIVARKPDNRTSA